MHSSTVDKQIKALRAQGLGYKTIAAQVGVDRDRVRYVCRRNGLAGYRSTHHTNPENALEHFLIRFEEKFGCDLVYVSGYDGSDSNIDVKCSVCGHGYSLNAQVVRKSRGHRCRNCVVLEREQDEHRELGQRVTSILGRHLNRMKGCTIDGCGAPIAARGWCGKHYQRWREHGDPTSAGRLIDVECRACHVVFQTHKRNRVYCSDECAKREANRRNEIRRRKQLRKNGRIDWSITLAGVMKRDRRKCILCGERVDTRLDPNDDRYPSIDHIIPVSKGGTHTWGNVQLAHRGCNAAKRDEMPQEVQLKLVM